MGDILDSAPTHYAKDAQLAIDPLSGAPVVAWFECEFSTLTCGDSKVYVKRWDGSSWTSLASGLSNGDVFRSQEPSKPPLKLKVDKLGRPVVVWRNRISQTTAIARWSGSSWVKLADISENVPDRNVYSNVYLTINSSNNPVVATNQINIPKLNFIGSIYLWDGISFGKIGSKVANSPTLSFPPFAASGSQSALANSIAADPLGNIFLGVADRLLSFSTKLVRLSVSYQRNLWTFNPNDKSLA